MTMSTCGAYVQLPHLILASAQICFLCVFSVPDDLQATFVLGSRTHQIFQR